jgi:hypothetical protein
MDTTNTSTKNNKTALIVVGIVLIIAAFFGGKAYGSSHATPSVSAYGAAGGYAGRTGMTGGFAGRMAGMGGGATIGQVVSMDATSITVSLTTGGSKIILYSPTTTVSKTMAGTISDVTVGSTITATGTANSDGSLTATAIQIRPADMVRTTSNPGGPMIPATAPTAQ